MTKSKGTKRALLSSVVALFLCFSMLLGTTFAWFTDTVTSAGNVIQSGTLDVDLVDAVTNDSMEGKVIDFVVANNGNPANILWEPGCTYETKPVKVVNKGSLALKYQISINGIEGNAKLLEAIDWYVTIDGNDIALNALNGILYAGNSSGELILKGHMREDAGNEYQGLTAEGISIAVFATQLTYEEDSYDDQYDKMATIDNLDELNTALAGDYDLIVLGANIELRESLVIPAGKTLTIDLCGYKLYQAYAQTTAYAMIYNKGNLTIKDSTGTGKISYEDIGTGGEYASNTIRNEGVLTINGGTIENISSDDVMNVGYPHAIDVYPGSVTTINGGTVKSVNYDAIRMFCNSTTSATIVNINGGTIYNRVSFQNPNNNTHTPGYGILNITSGNFITSDGVNANVRLLNFSRDFSNMKATVTGGTFDKGFKTQDYANCGVTVSDWLSYNGAVAVDSAEALVDAIAAGGSIALTSDIVMNNSVNLSDADFVLDGNGHTISMGNTRANTYALFDITGGKATIKNVTFDGIKDGAIVRTVGVEFNAYNVTAVNGNHTQVQGIFRLMGKSTIENCTFKNNVCNMVISLNYDGANNDPQVVKNCVFENNTCNATAVVYYVKGAGATIDGNKFIKNTVNVTGGSNAATLYMGFQENTVITNNVFENNTVNAGTSKRVAGALMIGYEAVITGNSFVGNTVTGENAKANDVAAAAYYNNIDLSGNYWGGSAPVENDDYYNEYPDNYSVIINDYLTTYGN